jgi:hypothetical protein
MRFIATYAAGFIGGPVLYQYFYERDGHWTKYRIDTSHTLMGVINFVVELHVALTG